MSSIKRWLAPPVFEGDEEKTRQARLVNMIGLSCLVLLLILLAGSLLAGSTPTRILIIDLLVGGTAFLQTLRWLRRGRVTLARFAIIIFGLAYLTGVIASIGTIREPTAGIFIFWVLMTGLLFGLGGILIGTPAASLAVLGLIVAENAGWLRQPAAAVGLTQWITFTALFGFTSGLSYYSIKSTESALSNAKREIEQRKRLNSALIDSEQRYRSLVELMPEALVVHRNGKIAYINPSAVKMFGAASASDLLDTAMLDRVHPDFHQVVFERVKHYSEHGGNTPMVQEKFLKLDGTVIDVEAQGAVISWDGEAVVQVVMHDITERKRVEATVTESEQRYRTLVEWTPEPIIVHARGTTRYVNPAAVKMFGATSASDLVGKPVLDLIHPDVHRSFLAQVRSSTDSWLGSGMVERKMLKLDGTVMDVEVQGMLISYDGRPAVQVAMRDVTEKNRIKASLTESEQRYRTLVEWTPEPIGVYRKDSRILFVNPAAVKMFGASSPRDLVGTLMIDRVHPDFRQTVLARLRNFADHGLNSPMMVQKLLKLDGTVIDVEVNGMVISYDGEPARQVSMRDITASKAVEAALEAARLKAENASQAKSRFLASASHDLRQPAHALGMFVARLSELPHDAQTRHLVGCVDDSVRAMQDMLDGLFDISRLDSDQTQISRVEFPIEAIFGPLRSSLSGAASDKGLRLRLRPSPAWVESDPGLLNRILLNLVSNAIRYTQHGSVLVACRPAHEGSQLRIEVRDSGVGIAPEHHEDIFQEFFQVDNPQRDRSKGLGVGLSIVERACRLLEHPLAMRSAPGCGTCFTVTVPLVPARVGSTYEEATHRASKDEFDGLRVLLIEDDALGRVGLASLLTSWGCSVTQAEGAKAACEPYRDEPAPDLIISDFRLGGGINGIEAVGMVRGATGQTIAACLISGDTDAKVREQAQAAGLTLLQKPVRPAKMRSLMRRLVQASPLQ